MKILHVISSINPAGGGPIEGVKQLGTALVAVGHQVELVSLDSPNAPFLQQFPLPVYPVGPATHRYGFCSRFIPWLRAHRTQYDAVVVNGIWQFHSFGAWRALHKSETPYVLFTHGMLDPWFKKQYPLKHLKKWMYWPWAEYRVLRDAQAVLFTCEEERILARSSFCLYRCNEVVVGYGTAKPRGDLQPELREFVALYPELQGKKLALFMGRIHPKKGCDLLIEAFAKVLGPHPDWQLVIAGPDQVGWQRALHDRALHLGLATRVTWLGMVQGAMKWGAFRAAEVLLLPSHQENFGIVVAEALASGLPTLITNKVNIWREIDSDGAGIVSEDSLKDFCTAIQSYLDLSAERKSAMRRAAQDCFEQRFEITRAAQTFCGVLNSISGVN